MPVASSEPAGRSPAELIGRLRWFGRRRHGLITVLGSLATAAVLVWLLSGHREEFVAALSSAPGWVLGATVLLQVVALVSRSEAWHLTINAAGGTRRPARALPRVEHAGLGSVLNGQLGVAARIAALRRSSPEICPQVPTLIAAEFPILAVEAVLAGARPRSRWWRRSACRGGCRSSAFAVIAAASAGLRRLALRKGRELWRGLAVLRSLRGGARVVGFVLVAVFAQIFRNWLLLHAVGVDASFFDAIAVLIAVVTLGQLPVGPASARPPPCSSSAATGSPGRRGGRADDRDRHARRLLLRGLGGRRPALAARPPGVATP